MYKFITFEGGDGSGKTTQSKKLHEYLLSQNIDAIWTREIGGTSIAEQIRNMVISNELLTKTELLLILAARNEHIEKVILPAIKAGKVVICDRFVDSTACYQSESEADMTRIYELHEMLFGNLLPDKTLILSVEPEIALARAQMRGEFDVFEMKGIEFHNKVHNNYKKLAAKHPNRIIEIPAINSPDEIFSDILHKLGL